MLKIKPPLQYATKETTNKGKKYKKRGKHLSPENFMSHHRSPFWSLCAASTYSLSFTLSLLSSLFPYHSLTHSAASAIVLTRFVTITRRRWFENGVHRVYSHPSLKWKPPWRTCGWMSCRRGHERGGGEHSQRQFRGKEECRRRDCGGENLKKKT